MRNERTGAGEGLMHEKRVKVRHYLAGGREFAGGIGRLVGYVVDAAGPDQAHRLSDTRGPRWSPARSLPRLGLALAAMLGDRIVAPGRIHHIHVAGRGSTIRKLILAGLARAIGCTHVLHLHDNDYAADLAARPPRQLARIRRMFQGADRVIVLGHRDRATVVERLGVAPSRTLVLRNCVPDPGPAAPPDRPVPTILFLGTLGPRKGVPELLEALASPAMTRLDWRAVLAGDGAVASYLREAARLGLGERVSMPGWLGRAKASALLAGADILVLPSHAEGMAMAVIEGLAHGRAVVATRVGAHEEAIEHGANGLFAPVGDAEALAATLARLVVDPALRVRLGAAARASYLERFSMGAYVGRLGALYGSLAPAPSGLLERKTT